MADVVTFVKDVGFPIFVALFLLLKVDSTIGRLDRTIKLQTVLLAKVTGVDIFDIVDQFGFDRKEFEDNGKRN